MLDVGCSAPVKDSAEIRPVKGRPHPVPRNNPLDRLGPCCYFTAVNGKLNLLLSSALLLCSAAVGS